MYIFILIYFKFSLFFSFQNVNQNTRLYVPQKYISIHLSSPPKTIIFWHILQQWVAKDSEGRSDIYSYNWSCQALLLIPGSLGKIYHVYLPNIFDIIATHAQHSMYNILLKKTWDDMSWLIYYIWGKGENV